jgi:His-Xaa-Ser system radical SAM maturase HxsC
MRNFKYLIADQVKPFIGVVREIDASKISLATAEDQIYTLNSSNDKNIFYNTSGYSVSINDVLLFEDNNKCTVLYEYLAKELVLSLTNMCNCKCIICPQIPKKDNKDHFNILIDVLKLAKDVKYICITGGEPTFFKEKLIKILEYINTYLPESKVQVLSNGKNFYDFRLVKELSNIIHKNTIFAISVYSSFESVHDFLVGVKGSFNKTIAGIYNLANFNAQIEIRTVLTKLNYKNLQSWARYISLNMPFIVHSVIMGQETINYTYKMKRDIWIDPYYCNNFIYAAITEFVRRKIPVSLYNLQQCILEKNLRNYSKKSISEWKRIYLDICKNCDIMSLCGGFFESNQKLHSKYIRPILNKAVKNGEII